MLYKTKHLFLSFFSLIYLTAFVTTLNTNAAEPTVAEQQQKSFNELTESIKALQRSIDNSNSNVHSNEYHSKKEIENQQKIVDEQQRKLKAMQDNLHHQQNKAAKIATNGFLESGWHPHIGLNFVYGQANVTNDLLFKSTINHFGVNTHQFFTNSEEFKVSQNSNFNTGSLVLGLGHMNKSNFYWGIEGEVYSGGKAQLNGRLNIVNAGQDNLYSGYMGTYMVKPMADIGLRFGYAINSIIMPYVKVGAATYKVLSSPYQQVLNNNSEAINDINNSILAAKTLRQSNFTVGYYVGAGADFKLSEHIFLRGEYNYSQVIQDMKQYYEQYITAAGDLGTTVLSNEKTRYGIHKIKVGIMFII